MENRVTHFEIPAEQPEQSMQFFKEVFDWRFEQMGEEEYWFAITGDSEPGINGAIMKKRHPEQPLANSIRVENIEATQAMIREAGGEVVVPKTEIPGKGWLSFFKDLDGYIHGLWQNL